LIKTGSSDYIWLWVAIEGPESKSILGFSISKEQNILIAEKYLPKNTEMSIESILLQLKMEALGIRRRLVDF
jgi:hypothetical protein